MALSLRTIDAHGVAREVEAGPGDRLEGHRGETGRSHSGSERTVLDYVLKPIRKAGQSALREREARC